jgi:uroporphyrinogen-III synthase
VSNKLGHYNLTESTRASLRGVRVLIARPYDQGISLTSRLRGLGAEVLQFPTIEVEATPNSQSLKNCFLNLDQYDHIVAISVHAVRFGLNWVDQYWPQLPLNIKWYAVGEKTAEALREADIQAITSKAGYDSESLLNLSELTELAHQKILILRGFGGRELLKQQFEQRGAKVDYADLYQRNCPNYTVSEINDALITFSPDILIALSGETLHNLVKISQNKDIAIDGRPAITDKAVLVPSNRVADQARSLGFSKVWVPQALNEQALIDCIESNYVTLNDIQ